MGRCIRHINDYGSIILIDDRFQQQQSLKNNLSKWVRDSLREYASYEACQQSLQAFFKRRETQPNPSTSPPLGESSALTAGSGGGEGGGGGDRRGGCGGGGCGGRGLGAGGEEYRQGDSHMTAANACKTLEGPGTGGSVAAGVQGWGGVKVVVGQCDGRSVLTGGAGVTREADTRLEAGKQREREEREERGREGGGGEKEREDCPAHVRALALAYAIMRTCTQTDGQTGGEMDRHTDT